MSALGQKQTSDCRLLMSALPPKADIAERNWDVRFVPKADVSRCSKNPLSKASLFDHLVGAAEERQRYA
jgi:hypothetical protein